ncbi:MAG: DUF1015 family protein [Ornithinimicrobium sp.]
MSAAHPIAQAWVSSGGTGAQNYDEFADDAEICDVISANPSSALAIEMPHLAPQSLGRSFTQSLPQARERLLRAQQDGDYQAHRDAVAVYRITGTDGSLSFGLFAMVDTAEISTSQDEPGRVIRNEDVFVAKVAERVALIEATGHLLSAVLLIQTQDPVTLQQQLHHVCVDAGHPDVRDLDPAGRVHEVWVVTDPSVWGPLCELAGAGELVVADGNHRSLAAQQAGLERFLAVITTADSLSLDPYHRLIREWPADLFPIDEALLAAGVSVEVIEGPVRCPSSSGVLHLYARGQGYALTWTDQSAADAALADGVPSDVVQSMDHARLERDVIAGLLGWNPADPRITYVGGDYPDSWLIDQVEQGHADVAVLVAPVTVDDFVAVNVDRCAMPRKSTWFTPKARAGLIAAVAR